MKTQNPIGSVVSLGRFGPAVITEAAYGPKYSTYKQGKVVGAHRKTRKPTPWYL